MRIDDVAWQQENRDSRPRSPKDTFITVYGRIPVLEVLEDETRHIDKLVIAEGTHGRSLDRILALANRRDVPIRYATAHRVKLLAGNGKQDQGIIADVIAPQMKTLSEFIERTRQGRRHHVLVLDGVNNPANVGLIIRTATAAGLSGVVLPHQGSPSIDPLVIKASAGVAFRASIVRAGTGMEAARELRQAGFRIYGLSGRVRRTLFEAEFPPRTAFVLGNETEGIADKTAEFVDDWISIPMEGGVESLNVASAAAVLCFDIVRRHHQATAAESGGPGRRGTTPTRRRTR